MDFGGNDDYPECDSDLENEVYLCERESSERTQDIK